MSSSAEEQSPIQAVEMVRAIRDAIYEETKHLSREELKDYFAREAAAMREESRRSQDGGESADVLIKSLHQEAGPDAEGAWEVEVRRRVEELESGAVETIPWTEVRKRLFRGFE